MTERNEQHQMGALLFILGLMAGGIVSFFFAGMLQTRRIDRYEQIVVKLRKQNKILADALPKDNRKNIIGVDRCVCCGETIPEGQMVCQKCLRDCM